MHRPLFLLFVTLLFTVGFAPVGQAQDSVGEWLDAFVADGRAPAISVAIAKPDGSVHAWTRGVQDAAGKLPLQPHHELMSGSVGKTYFAALAVDMIDKGELDVDSKLIDHIGHLDWAKRLPNAQTITLKHLMRHTSGVMDHINMPAFWEKVHAKPRQPWTRAELMEFLLDQEPLFEAGSGWAYADANYILLGLALEEVLGESVHREVWKRFLQPLGLKDTHANNSHDLPGLAQGWHILGEDWPEARPTIVAGKFYFTPQIEWCGGGYRSTTSDLARWGAALYGGKAISTEARVQMLGAAVAARLSPGDQYGYGVIVSPTKFGPAQGHSGWFPGYLSEMRWFPDLGVCIAVQVNTDDVRKTGPTLAWVTEIAALVKEHKL